MCVYILYNNIYIYIYIYVYYLYHVRVYITLRYATSHYITYTHTLRGLPRFSADVGPACAPPLRLRSLGSRVGRVKALSSGVYGGA